MSTQNGIKLTAILSAILGVLGAVFGGWSEGFELRATVSYFFVGCLLGAVMAPELEPSYFKYPKTWQVLFSIAGCSLLAFVLKAPLEGYLLAVTFGSLLGLTARYWVKHVTFP